jgi:ribonuclease PH
MRKDRVADELRPTTIVRNYIAQAAGSVLISMGSTRVICTASIVPGVPAFLKEAGQGWITAEYGMLPASTAQRKPRPRLSHTDGRGQEIQRLLGRSFRAVTELKALGERTIWIDCDVIQADGGTRTAAITGGYVALVDACRKLMEAEEIFTWPIRKAVAAVSVGVVQGESLLDLDYREDAAADVDMNVVMTAGGRLVEIQGTAEGQPFSQSQLMSLLKLARKGINELLKIQQEALTKKTGRE